MKSGPTEDTPTTVRHDAIRVGEIRDRWSWVEPEVWTDRMLTALEHGVKGGKWHALIDKVYSRNNLLAAFTKVQANGGKPGTDRMTIEMFVDRLDDNLERLSHDLRTGRYRPQAIKRVWIPKPGRKEKRPLGIPTVRDRVVQAALLNVLEPIFERDFAPHSYGFRPGRGCKDALRRVDSLLKQGYTHVVDADLQAYFDTISHDLLLGLIRAKVSDTRILGLVASFLKQKVLETVEGWTPEQGTPQGAVISPLLSNIFLDPLDHLLASAGLETVRYADDFVILCRSDAEARCALTSVFSWTTTHGLSLHPDKTVVVDATLPGGFDFLGYHFERGRRWPRKKSVKKLHDTIRRKTRRAHGQSLSVIIEGVNRTLVGWFAYFKHSHPFLFPRLDGWIRMRLRSILRKRSGRSGRGRGYDHMRWPNAFFADLGLFSLVSAHASACQSSMR